MTKRSEETLPEKIGRAKASGIKFSATTDELNAGLERAEKAIAALRLGVSASVDITEPELANQGDYEAIEFAKTGGEWRLVHSTGNHLHDDSWTMTPVLKSSREIRFAAAKNLSKLVDALLEAVEQQQAEADELVASVDRLVRDLER